MAKPLDLEEQEQLDEIKHFWKQYGNLITWALIIVFGSIAAWNGYTYWQRHQASQSSAMYDQVEVAAKGGDLAMLDRALSDMTSKYGGTTYAQQAALLAAKTYYDQGKTDQAKAALSGVIERSSDEGYRAVARLRLASIFIEAKAYDEALKQLDASYPAEFAALVADRRADVFQLQGKTAEAKAEYIKAYKAFEDRVEYRRLVEVKLNAMGVDPAATATSPETSK